MPKTKKIEFANHTHKGKFLNELLSILDISGISHQLRYSPDSIDTGLLFSMMLRHFNSLSLSDHKGWFTVPKQSNIKDQLKACIDTALKEESEDQILSPFKQWWKEN